MINKNNITFTYFMNFVYAGCKRIFIPAISPLIKPAIHFAETGEGNRIKKYLIIKDKVCKFYAKGSFRTISMQERKKREIFF